MNVIRYFKIFYHQYIFIMEQGTFLNALAEGRKQTL